MKTFFSCAWLMGLCAFAAHGAEFDLGARGVLTMQVPEGWSANSQEISRPGADGSTIAFATSFKPPEGANAKCSITFLYVTNRPPDKATIRVDVLRMGERYASGSVEKKKVLRDFSLEQGYGAYSVFTDASLVGKKTRAGQYRVIGVGEVQPSENLLGALSLFADDAEGKEFKAMLGMVNSMKVTPKAAKETK
jgi:hypothetical protein